MDIQVNKDISLTKSRREDKSNLVKYLNEWEIAKNTLLIPFPYTEEDADAWLDYILAYDASSQVQRHWVIRNGGSELIGGIGLHYPYGLQSHKNELGYWLAKPYWNKGIMTEVINVFAGYCLNELKIIRLEATVFAFNDASAKVLSKCGFEYEGLLRSFHLKGNQLIDAKMFAKVVPSAPYQQMQ